LMKIGKKGKTHSLELKKVKAKSYEVRAKS
jgi:hypothetical protein